MSPLSRTRRDEVDLSRIMRAELERVQRDEWIGQRMFHVHEGSPEQATLRREDTPTESAVGRRTSRRPDHVLQHSARYRGTPVPSGTLASAMKVALVHYWLVGMRGGEKVLEVLCDLYPDADIFTLVLDRQAISEKILRHRIFTSGLQRIGGRRYY